MNKILKSILNNAFVMSLITTALIIAIAFVTKDSTILQSELGQNICLYGIIFSLPVMALGLILATNLKDNK